MFRELKVFVNGTFSGANLLNTFSEIQDIVNISDTWKTVVNNSITECVKKS